MSTPPIFQAIFGDQWNQLPAVMHKHYANRPFSEDVVTVEGIMKVELSPLARMLSPLLRLSGALVPYSAENITTTVHFRSEKDTAAFCFDRIFRFPQKPLYHFRSRMIPVGSNEVVEYMPIGIGWHAAFHYDGKRVLLTHRGYRIKLFGKEMRAPLEWLLGKGEAFEEAMDDNRFLMRMDIRHALFGLVYSYSGVFTVSEVKYG